MFEEAKKAGKRAKILLWGQYGTGKTVLALQFPKPALIDMERGAEHYSEKYEFKTFRTTSPSEVRKGILWLKNNKHDRQTVILDSMTEYWSALQREWQATLLERNRRGAGYKIDYYDIQPKDWTLIKNDFRAFMRDLLSLDMHIVVTCREKDMFSESEMLKKIGVTFDSDRSLPYLFDTVVRMERRNNSYVASVEKDRTGVLPATFPSEFSIFAKAFGFEAHMEVPKASEEKKRVEPKQPTAQILDEKFPYLDDASLSATWAEVASGAIDVKGTPGREYMKKLASWKDNPEVAAAAKFVLENTKEMAQE